MARTLSSLLIASKNSLESTSPWLFLYELSINDAAATFRIVNYDQSVTFQGLTFDPFPVQLDSLTESDAGNISTMRVTASNVNQEIIALCENYWTSVLEPEWIVSVWRVDATQPNETPLASKDVYEVVSVATDLINATFDLRWQGMTMTRRIPGRRYTRSGGFANIPRRIR